MFKNVKRSNWVSGHMMPRFSGCQSKADLVKWSHMALLSQGTSVHEFPRELALGLGLPTRNNTLQRGCPRGFVDFSEIDTLDGNIVFSLLRSQAKRDPAAVAYLIGTASILMAEDNGSEAFIIGLEDLAKRELERT